MLGVGGNLLHGRTRWEAVVTTAQGWQSGVLVFDLIICCCVFLQSGFCIPGWPQMPYGITGMQQLAYFWFALLFLFVYMHHLTQLIWSWGSNSGLYASAASTLPTEPHAQAPFHTMFRGVGDWIHGTFEHARPSAPGL